MHLSYYNSLIAMYYAPAIFQNDYNNAFFTITYLLTFVFSPLTVLVTMRKLIRLQKMRNSQHQHFHWLFTGSDRRFVSVLDKLQRGQEQQEITMLIYQQIILLIISSTNIIFAENFFQPVYEKRTLDPPLIHYNPLTSYPYYIHNPDGSRTPIIPDYGLLIEQLKKLFSKSNPETREDNPVYAAIARSSNLVGYPEPHHHYPYYHNYISRRPINTLNYVKLKPREYVQPSIFVAHPNSLAAHYRRKRSTDFTDVKSSKSTIDDVATKPSLIDTKDSTVIDSLLPENESKNDKHVRTRQSDFKIKPFLFGLDPSKMSKRQAKSLDNLDGKKDETQHSVSKRHHTSLNTPVFFTQSTPDSTKATITEPAAQTAQQTLYTFQEKEQYQEPSHTNENPRFILNIPSTNFEQPSSSITTSQRDVEQLPEGGEPIDGRPNCKSYDNGSVIRCKEIRKPYLTQEQIYDKLSGRNAEMYPNTRNNMEQSSSSITTSQRQLPEGGEPIDGQPNCKSYDNDSVIICISDKKITVPYLTQEEIWHRLNGRNAEMYPNTRNNMEQSSSWITTSQRDVEQLPEGGEPIDGRPNCKSYDNGSVIRCKEIRKPYLTQEQIYDKLSGRNAEMYPNTRNNMEQSSSWITTFQRDLQLPEGGKPIDGRPKCKSYNDGSLILCISDKKIERPAWYLRPDPFDGKAPNYIMRNAEMYPNTRNNMDQDFLQETANTDATHIIQPRERTKVYITKDNAYTDPSTANNPFPRQADAEVPHVRSAVSGASNPNEYLLQILYSILDGYYKAYYLNNIHQKDYLDVETDNSGYHTNYDYDNDNTLTYQTNDGLDIYTRGNSAYSRNVPSKQIDDNMLYGDTNARSNIAPMTYTALTSSNIPQMQQQPLYAYYPPRKYVTYTPQHYNYYKPYNDNYQDVSKGFYRFFWPSTYNY